MHDLRARVSDFQRALAGWYATAQRPLPWRTKPSLYRTVVSELMAQQTQIKTMLPYFERWMQHFPDFETLAEAPAEDVLKHWEGLGYYSRARNLHKLAQAYVALDPKPRSADQWQALPGIGPYTSAAISSIALGYPAAVVDGNVVRILARLTADERIFKNNGEAVKAFTPLAGQMLNRNSPGDHNQAMMELGATVCLKRKPHCSLCPVSKFCQSYARSDIEDLPRIQRRATEQVEIHRAWLLKDNRIFLHRIPDDSGQLAGQYELPRLSDLGLEATIAGPITTKTRSITHRRIKEHIYQIKPNPTVLKKCCLNPTIVSIPLSKLHTVTLSGPHRRWLIELLDTA